MKILSGKENQISIRQIPNLICSQFEEITGDRTKFKLFSLLTRFEMKILSGIENQISTRLVGRKVGR